MKTSTVIFLYIIFTYLLVCFAFLLLLDSIPIWWLWGYWISPMMYAQNAISVNEFLGHSWQKVLLLFRQATGVYISRSIHLNFHSFIHFPVECYEYW
jgi:hypothetical protein